MNARRVVRSVWLQYDGVDTFSTGIGTGRTIDAVAGAALAGDGAGVGSAGAFIRSMMALRVDRSVAMIVISLPHRRSSARLLLIGPQRQDRMIASWWGCVMSWDSEFDEPVPLPRNRQARTLREAADYVMRLPKSEQDLPEWQAAVSALMVVAEHKGPPMFARIGMMQALSRCKPPAAPSERKDTPWGRRPLKRDR